MARYVAWAFAALLLVPSMGTAGELCEKSPGQGKQGAPAGQTVNGAAKPDGGHPQRPKFWVDPKLRAEFGITDQQSVAIEAIWKKDLKERGESGDRLATLEKQLDQMMLDAALDEAAFLAQLDKVESARSQANKARMLMLYRINKVLTPDQRAKLAAKAQQMRAQRDGRGDHR
jgi:Spy/CpxP family protein refolding chaperone